MRWRASGSDIGVLSVLLHDGGFALDAGQLDADSSRYRLPIHRLDHARVDEQRYLFVTVRSVPARACRLVVSDVTEARVVLDCEDDPEASEAGLLQSLSMLEAVPSGLVIHGTLGGIELTCRNAPVVEVEDGPPSSVWGSTDFGRVLNWEAVAKELERLRVEG